MTESDRDPGRRRFEQVWNQKRCEAIAEMLAPDAVLHDCGSNSFGPEGFYPFFNRICSALSDMRVKVQDTLAEGDKMCVRWAAIGRSYRRRTGDGSYGRDYSRHRHIDPARLRRPHCGGLAELGHARNDGADQWSQQSGDLHRIESTAQAKPPTLHVDRAGGVAF
jgi:hypothetical protein